MSYAVPEPFRYRWRFFIISYLWQWQGPFSSTYCKEVLRKMQTNASLSEIVLAGCTVTLVDGPSSSHSSLTFVLSLFQAIQLEEICTWKTRAVGSRGLGKWDMSIFELKSDETFLWGAKGHPLGDWPSDFLPLRLPPPIKNEVAASMLFWWLPIGNMGNMRSLPSLSRQGWLEPTGGRWGKETSRI